MNKNKIKTIFFDFGGTLDSDGIEWGLRLLKKLNDAGLAFNKDNFMGAAKKSMDQLFDNKESAFLNYKQAIDIYIYWVIKNLELIIEDYKKVLVDPFYLESVRYIERNRKLLERLSGKFTLGIISNNFGNCKGWCNEFSIDNYFKVIIDSNIIGFRKPDKRIFEIACKKIGSSFEECVYVGDKYMIDIEPVIKLGIQPIWINSNNSKQKIVSKVIKIKTLPDLKNIFEIKDELKLLI